MRTSIRLIFSVIAAGAFLLGPNLSNQGGAETGTSDPARAVAGGFEWAVTPDSEVHPVGDATVDGGFEWA
ncbi:hypothetical protein ACLQ22_03040 [Micromonospora sp. DT178]